MLSAFLAAISNAIEVTQSKHILKKYQMPAKTLLSLGSVLIFFVMAILFLVWGYVDVTNIKIGHLLVFVGIIAAGYIDNFFYYYSLKRGDLCDVEPLAMLQPLVSMLLAIIIYPDERNFLVVAIAVVASLVLIYSRVEKHHLKINKYSLSMLGFVLFAAVEANLVKYVIEVFSPVALYTIRIGILSSIFLVTVRPNLKKVSKGAFWHTLGMAVIVAIEYPMFYLAIERVGVVVTSLVMLLAPALILISSKVFFKEKMTPKKAISDAIILLCIAAAILLK